MEEEKTIDVREEKRSNIIQTVFLVFLIIAIAVMIGAIITVHNYADMLKNPLGYNLAKFGIESCSYLNNNGEMVVIQAINSS